MRNFKLVSSAHQEGNPKCPVCAMTPVRHSTCGGLIHCDEKEREAGGAGYFDSEDRSETVYEEGK